MEKGIIFLNKELLEYEIHVVGPPILQGEVVDSTGAGDAFIAGYLWSINTLSKENDQELDIDTIAFRLKMASWVAGMCQV